MPHTLGPFRLLRVVGAREGAAVYEAAGPDGTERLTVLEPEALCLPAGGFEALRADVRAAAPTRHPSLILPRELGRDGILLFIAAPHVDGETLARYLARAGRLPPMQGLALLAQLLDALACAGPQGWVHGAIHPGHLLVAPNGQLQIDGSTGVAAAGTRRPGPFDSTPFLAPEVAHGGQPDPRADLYSAAVVAYQLLVGALPWEDEGRTRVRPVRSLRRELPAALDAVFGRALADSPDARYASAAQLWSALHAALGSPVWERARAPARSAATIAAVSRNDSPPPAAPVAAPAVSDNPGSAAPLPRRAAVALMAGCTAIALWTAGLWNPPAVQRPADRVLASQALPAASFTVPVPVAPPLEGGSTTPPRPAAGSSPATAPVLPPADLQRPAAHAQAARAPAAAHEERPADASKDHASKDDPSTASTGPATHRTRIRPHPHPAPRQQPMSKSASADLPCDSRKGFAREMCTVLRCATAEFRRHPVCVRLHREGEARLQLAASRGAP